MTKNEELMIEDWIRYHGHLFGYENLFIIDGSDEPAVFDIYKKYAGRGLNVQHSDANLNEITKVINETMHRYKGEDNFLIKLDTDEFLAYVEPFYSECSMFEALLRKAFLRKKNKELKKKGIAYWAAKIYLRLIYGAKSLHNLDINSKLKALPLTGQKYKASFTAWAIPVELEFVDKPCSTISLFTPLQYTNRKSFFHSESFTSVDLGGHDGVAARNEGAIDTGLVTIHYANISVKDSVRRARQALISHGYINESDTFEQCRGKLLKFVKGGYNSFHKVSVYLKYIDSTLNKKYFLPGTLNEFYRHYHKTDRVRKINLVRDTLAK